MAEYPSEYELDVVLRDGGGARVRPMRSDDGELLRSFFEKLGPESRYFRFFKIKKSLSDDEVEYFTNLDYHDRMALVAVLGGEIVAVGRYDREPDDPTVAEVAFAVADDQQGRGLGTELLELLTTHARDNGVDQFKAFVLSQNRQMMRVFRNSGFELSRTMDSGVYTVDFPVRESVASRAAEAEREKRAVAASILPFFFPKAIAVIGASNDETSIGGRLFNNILTGGFVGPLYPINPGARVVRSVRAYPSILDVPDEVDLAYIVVPRNAVLEVAQQCADKGVRAIVVISAGFSEVGEEGAEAERRLLEIVRSSGMRMVGPNCMGLLNTADAVRLNGTFAPVYPPHGNVAMSSQSGALGIAILDYATRNDIGISQFVSVGNKADVSGNDLILAWEDDPQTDVITLYLESFGNPRKFARIARRIGRSKPIIAVKSGRSRAGSRAASSHTGALASSDVAVNALFRQAGVIRVDTIEELFDAANLLSNQPIPQGNRVGVITNAGGPGILAADALEAHDLEVVELSESLQAKIGEKLPAEASTRNPVDLIASGGPNEFEHATRLILQSGEVDSLIVIYVPTTPQGAGEVAAALRRCQADYDGPVTFLSIFMQGDLAGQALAGEDGARTIPSYMFPEDGALALSRAVNHGQWRQRDPGEEFELDDAAAQRIRNVTERALKRFDEDGGWLDPEEIDECLGAAGLRTPVTRVARTIEDARSLAAEIDGPVVIKVISESALHKSDVGGVVLNVQGDDEVGAAFHRVTSVVDDYEGVLVQEFIEGGHEVLVGTSQDPNFGPLVAFGLGGVYVELLKDVAFRIFPITDVDAAEMVREPKGSRLLDGYRNNPQGDVPALEDALCRVSALITEMPELVEMDLNPVKVLPPGEGIVVVDARMRVRPVPASQSRSLKDLPGVTTQPPQLPT
ncbi:MAG: GNAT family N-acetyltransferase [Acidimicrobiia bacterium]|jgi:acetyl coenzyme A synthetase (ADP forming)-like protein